MVLAVSHKSGHEGISLGHRGRALHVNGRGKTLGRFERNSTLLPSRNSGRFASNWRGSRLLLWVGSRLKRKLAGDASVGDDPEVVISASKPAFGVDHLPGEPRAFGGDEPAHDLGDVLRLTPSAGRESRE